MRAFSRIVATGCITLLAASWAWGAGPSVGQGAIRWEPNFETAMQKAAQQNRLVLLHFWGDGCIPCEGVERNVFPDPSVAQAIDGNYVAVKVHAQGRPDLVQRFGVQAWPTDVIVTPDGKKVAQHISPQEPQRYLQMIREVAAREQSGGFGAPAGALAQNTSFRPPAMEDRGSSFPMVSGPASPPMHTASGGGEFPLGGNRGLNPAPPQGPSPGFDTNAPQQNFADAYRPDQSLPQQPNPHQPPPMQPPHGNTFNTNPSPYNGPNPYAGPQPNFGGAPPAAPPNVGSPAFPAPPAQAPNYGQPPQGAPAGRMAQTPPGHQNYYSPAAPPPSVAGNAPAPQAAPAGPPPAMDGYCVVSLLEQLQLPQEQQRWKKGDPRWGAIHRGRTYLFAGPEEQRRFLANPDYFAPALSGSDPVAFTDQGRLADGRREHGLTYQGKIYLFESEANLQRFWNSPGAFIARVQQAMNAPPNQPPQR